MIDFIRDAGLLWAFLLCLDQYLVMLAEPWECSIPSHGGPD